MYKLFFKSTKMKTFRTTIQVHLHRVSFIVYTMSVDTYACETPDGCIDDIK